LAREIIPRRARRATIHFAGNKRWNHSNRRRAGLWCANALVSPVAGPDIGKFLNTARWNSRAFNSLALAPAQIPRELPTLVLGRLMMRKQEPQDARMPATAVDRGAPREAAADRAPVELAFFFDSAFVIPAAVAIASVLANSDRRRAYVAHVFHLGTDTDALAPVVALERPHFKIEVHDLAADIARLAPRGWPDAIYFHRILLGDLLPRSRRVLYLDTDTVATSDVAELFDTPLNGAPLGACIDLPVGRRRALDRVIRLRKFTGTVRAYMREVLGLSDEAMARYFNSGVVLFDLERARETGLSRGALEIISRDADRIWLHDQCILNRLPNPITSSIQAGTRWCRRIDSAPCSIDRPDGGNSRPWRRRKSSISAAASPGTKARGPPPAFGGPTRSPRRSRPRRCAHVSPAPAPSPAPCDFSPSRRSRSRANRGASSAPAAS